MTTLSQPYEYSCGIIVVYPVSGLETCFNNYIRIPVFSLCRASRHRRH